MLSTYIPQHLKENTLREVTKAVKVADWDALSTKKDHKNALAKEMQSQGARQLAYIFSKEELETIISNLDLDLNNPEKEGSMFFMDNAKSKSVFVKRLIEDIEKAASISAWVNSISNDEEIIEILCDALNIKKNSQSSINVKHITKAVEQFGAQVVFNRLDAIYLKLVAEDLSLKNADKTTSQRLLVDAIVNLDHVKVQKKKIQKVSIGAKKPIAKCTTYQQLFQHYKRDELENWCRKQGLKTTGTKKIVINRILAFLSGDKENTMANTRTSPKSRRRSKPVVQEESDDEELEDAESEEDLDAQDEVPEVENSEVESEMESEQEEEEENFEIENKSFCVSGNFDGYTKADIHAQIEELGGKVHKNVTKNTDYVLTPDVEGRSKKIQLARTYDVQVIGMEYFEAIMN